jgi:hypothetical protein
MLTGGANDIALKSSSAQAGWSLLREWQGRIKLAWQRLTGARK